MNKVAQSCPTLCDLMDCSPPGSLVNGIFPAWILEWVVISRNILRKSKTIIITELRYDKMLELPDKKFEVTMTNVLKILMEIKENMQIK